MDIGPSILELAGIPIPSYMDGSPQLYNKNVKHRKFIYASKDRLDEFEFRERAVRDSRFKYIKNYNTYLIKIIKIMLFIEGFFIIL